MKIKVRCKGYKRGEKYFTIGKVYEWEDGRLKNDNNFIYDTFMCKGTDPQEWNLSGWYDFEVVQDQEIVITTDGKETLARLYEGNKVIKTATARCAPDDTFDFATGAKLAFERLMGEQKEATPENAEWRVVHRAAKVGDYIRLTHQCYTFDEVGDILKVDVVKAPDLVSVYGRNHKRDTHDGNWDWNYLIDVECEIVEPVEPEQPAETEERAFKVGDMVMIVKGLRDVGKIGTIIEDDGTGSAPFRVQMDNGALHWKFGSNLEKVEFTPHLVIVKDHYGNIGEPTNYKDAIGRPLCVGDVVEHFDDHCESYGDTVIVKRKLSYRNNEEKTFVMGIEGECNDKDGTTGEWKILKKRSFDEVENGEVVFGIKYVKGI